jgi:energy-converting hydrogenase Eha subunit H
MSDIIFYVSLISLIILCFILCCKLTKISRDNEYLISKNYNLTRENIKIILLNNELKEQVQTLTKERKENDKS